MNDKERLEAIFDTLPSEGWKCIKSDIEEFYQQINSIENIYTEAELNYRKGELARIGFILNLEDWYQHQYDNL